eukprot:jgi/Tetstr1/444801/TSEL_032649.t1
MRRVRRANARIFRISIGQAVHAVHDREHLCWVVALADRRRRTQQLQRTPRHRRMPSDPTYCKQGTEADGVLEEGR